MMRKFNLILLLIWIALPGYSQQRPLHSLYMFDPVTLNPAYVGTHVQLSGTAIYRNQWVNFPGAPKTFTASVHSGFRKARVGTGILFGNDQIGVHSDQSVFGMYSYKIPLSQNKGGGVISFGLQAGFNLLKSDFGMTNPRDGAEIGRLTKNNWNFGTGVFFRNKDIYAGFSVPYIVHNKVLEILDEAGGTLIPAGKQQRYYYLMGGLTKKLSPQVKWMPSTLIRVQENAPLTFDINNMFILHDVVGIGLSYRLNDSVIGLFELQLNENFHVGYAYDITMSDIKLYSNGSHEIMINYRIKIPKIHTGLECPSYW